MARSKKPRGIYPMQTPHGERLSGPNHFVALPLEEPRKRAATADRMKKSTDSRASHDLCVRSVEYGGLVRDIPDADKATRILAKK